MNTYSKEVEVQMIKFYQSLDESSQRRYAALEASRLGHGGKKYIKNLLSTSYPRISRGLSEYKKEALQSQDGRIRKEGGGRKRKKTIQK